MVFSELGIGDTFSFTAHLDRDAWRKNKKNEAQLVNTSETRYVGPDEQVSMLISAAERAEAIRRIHAS